MKSVSIGHYCNSYKSKNPNDIVVSIGELDIYFSYTTPVAFRSPEGGLTCRVNVWGPTTGKHLNAIEPDKSKRVPSEHFENLLDNVLKLHGLA